MSAGVLYVVGTPIGNLGDMSPRAVAALTDSRLIACEDTRRTGKLLQHLEIPRRQLLRFDEHTEVDAADSLIREVQAGSVVAVVSDAGMPSLSDPGSVLIKKANEAGIRVEVIPGPFAAAHAAVASGLLDSAGRFRFDGFLPRKGKEREDRINDVVLRDVATVLYESPHRVAATVSDLAEVCGAGRQVALCRELTKMYEQVWRGTLAEAVEELEHTPPRGEYVLVVARAEPPAEVADDVLLSELESEIAAGATHKDAATSVSLRHGVARNRVKKLISY